MTPTKNIPDKATSGLTLALRRLQKKLPPNGFFFLAAILIGLSALAATDFSARQPLLSEGDIAPVDIIADSTVLFRDRRATYARQETARKMQPLVVDFSLASADKLRETVQTIFLDINGADSPEQKEAVRERIAQTLHEDISQEAVEALCDPVVQNLILASLLPLAEQRLRKGALAELSVANAYPGGILIRNSASGEETLFQESYNVADLIGIKLVLDQEIGKRKLSLQAKKISQLLFDSLIQPTLIPNFDETRQRAEGLARRVDPVMYRVLKGEIIAQQGDRITLEQQVKMQVLLQRKEEPFHERKFLGIALCSLIISTGLLFSPSGIHGTAMTNKDFVFLAVLLVLFSLLSKGLAAHGAQIAAVSIRFLPESLAYAVPVAGAAALSSQIFAARRYLVTGLLLAFFCSLMFNGGIGLFIFYFFAAMWSTWLTGKASSRQDVVWSVLPLTAGLLAMWSGATLMQDGAYNRYFSEMVAVCAGAALSMVITFALSPVVEMVFGYTTRFRLMELLNLEQPLLRELMISAPGTYHHSLIVSNMCEAGAKKVGANSLLCKVAALYHDIGKTTKAGYFIENQPTDDNPHNRLSPSMSALILIAHVKQGVELANQHRLGKEVTGIIRQHHGTSIIQYFYNKALNQTDVPPPNIEDFRYPGPRPQSKEAALIMLADIVEASSRTLSDPTPTRLRQHIDNIMKSTYSAGQLDESELTFKDLDSLAESFQQVLRGLYHHRIAYPGAASTKPQPGKPVALKQEEEPAVQAIVPRHTVSSVRQ